MPVVNPDQLVGLQRAKDGVRNVRPHPHLPPKVASHVPY